MSIGIGSSYNEFSGWDYDEGYHEAIRLVKEHVTQMRDYYKQGVMCSLSESVQGECTCNEILKYLEELAKR